MTEINLFVVVFSVIAGVLLGHYLTMKAFAHVQPSTKDLIKEQREKTVTVEPDPWADEGIEEMKIQGASESKDIWEHLEKQTGIKVGNPNDFVGFTAGEPTEERKDDN